LLALRLVCVWKNEKEMGGEKERVWERESVFYKERVVGGRKSVWKGERVRERGGASEESRKIDRE